jgi:hypothetical protein
MDELSRKSMKTLKVNSFKDIPKKSKIKSEFEQEKLEEKKDVNPEPKTPSKPPIFNNR